MGKQQAYVTKDIIGCRDGMTFADRLNDWVIMQTTLIPLADTQETVDPVKTVADDDIDGSEEMRPIGHCA